MLFYYIELLVLLLLFVWVLNEDIYPWFFFFMFFFCINFNIIFDFSNGTYFTRIPFICQPSSLCFHRIFIYKILFTAEFEIYDTWYSCSCQGIIKCVLILIESDFFPTSSSYSLVSLFCIFNWNSFSFYSCL